MLLIRCDHCDRTEPVDTASGWLEVTRGDDDSSWSFCSMTCIAAWSAEAVER